MSQRVRHYDDSNKWEILTEEDEIVATVTRSGHITTVFGESHSETTDDRDAGWHKCLVWYADNFNGGVALPMRNR